MIALHFRDSPLNILQQPSIFRPGNEKHFGGLPFLPCRDPDPIGRKY